MESKNELLIKKTSLSMFTLSNEIVEAISTSSDAETKKLLSSINSSLKNIDSKLLKDFDIKFSDKSKSEIVKFL